MLIEVKERKSNIYSVTVLRKIWDHVAIFPVLSHAHSLRQRWVIPPCVRAVIFLFHNSPYWKNFTDNLTFVCIILHYSSQVLAWIHAVPLFARLSKALYWDL